MKERCYKCGQIITKGQSWKRDIIYFFDLAFSSYPTIFGGRFYHEECPIYHEECPIKEYQSPSKEEIIDEIAEPLIISIGNMSVIKIKNKLYKIRKLNEYPANM